MKSLIEKSKIDNAIMRILKLTEIRHVLAHTSKGDLCLTLPFEGGAKDYRFVCDSVPLEKEENDKLMRLYNFAE